jgi:hypothetical protein
MVQLPTSCRAAAKSTCGSVVDGCGHSSCAPPWERWPWVQTLPLGAHAVHGVHAVHQDTRSSCDDLVLLIIENRPATKMGRASWVGAQVSPKPCEPGTIKQRRETKHRVYDMQGGGGVSGAQSVHRSGRWSVQWCPEPTACCVGCVSSSWCSRRADAWLRASCVEFEAIRWHAKTVSESRLSPILVLGTADGVPFRKCICR